MKPPSEICFELLESCDAARTGDSCAQCAAYGAALGLVPGRPGDSETSEALPTGLAARLRGIAEDFETSDRLYASAMVGEVLGERIPPGEADNPGRRAAHDALAVAFADARQRRPLPPALAARLRAIPRRRAAEQLPRWLTDSRWATAACLLLTAALGLAAGDASARFEQTASVVGRAPQWLEQTYRPELPAEGSDLRDLWSALRQDARQRLDATIDRLDIGQRMLSGGLEETAITSYETAAARLKATAETCKNSKTARWLAEFVHEGEDHE